MATSNSPVRDAVEQAGAEQSWMTLRKDTLAAALVLVVWLAQELAERADLLVGQWAWVGPVAGVIASVGAIWVHRKTPGSITPSMAPRLENALNRVMDGRRREWDAQQEHIIPDDATADYGAYTQG